MTQLNQRMFATFSQTAKFEMIPVLAWLYYGDEALCRQCAGAHLCSAGIGGGQIAGSPGFSSTGGAMMSLGFSDLKLSSVATMDFTCSYSSVSSSRTFTQAQWGKPAVSTPDKAETKTSRHIKGLWKLNINTVHGC